MDRTLFLHVKLKWNCQYAETGYWSHLQQNSHVFVFPVMWITCWGFLCVQACLLYPIHAFPTCRRECLSFPYAQLIKHWAMKMYAGVEVLLHQSWPTHYMDRIKFWRCCLPFSSEPFTAVHETGILLIVSARAWNLVSQPERRIQLRLHRIMERVFGQ